MLSIKHKMHFDLESVSYECIYRQSENVDNKRGELRAVVWNESTAFRKLKFIVHFQCICGTDVFKIKKKKSYFIFTSNFVNIVSYLKIKIVT